ncbi:MAG: SRPBCC family protein [Aureispira sp.]
MSTLGQATTQKTTFSRSTNISQVIQADAATIWALLTNSNQYPDWNSTIVSIEGNIAAGNKIQLKSTLDPSRTFKLTIKAFIPHQQLVWGDAMGERTYRLEPQGGHTLFTMHEKIGGLFFPLFANKIPSFDASFEQFAADLKAAAESFQQ